jgi:hypothetical protein
MFFRKDRMKKQKQTSTHQTNTTMPAVPRDTEGSNRFISLLLGLVVIADALGV